MTAIISMSQKQEEETGEKKMEGYRQKIDSWRKRGAMTFSITTIHKMTHRMMTL
jgi:hypothetical protein